MCQPCSSVADAIAPAADSTSKRAALPFVSCLCSATRVSLLALAMPHSAPRRRCLPALSSRQLAAQVNDLPYMMIRMPRTTHENLETIRGFRLPFGRIRLSPVCRALLSNRRRHHRHGAVKRSQRFVLPRWLPVRELPVAVAHVSRLGNASSYVIVQIAGHVQHQVSNAVPVRVWLAPKLFVRKRAHPLMQLRRNIFVIGCQPRNHRFVHFRHEGRPLCTDPASYLNELPRRRAYSPERGAPLWPFLVPDFFPPFPIESRNADNSLSQHNVKQFAFVRVFQETSTPLY